MNVQDIDEMTAFFAPQTYLTAVRRPPSPLPGLSLPIARLLNLHWSIGHPLLCARA